MAVKSVQVRRKVFKILENSVKQATLQMWCLHEWAKHSLGFKCSNCGFYTGTNSELNNLLK